jgi:hypothetical protein
MSESTDQTTLDIDVALLRTRVEAAALQVREAELKAAKRGRLLERILQLVNGATYHYISIQLAPGQEVADVLADNPERVMDFFVAPLDRLARMATDPDHPDELCLVAPSLDAARKVHAQEMPGKEGLGQLPPALRDAALARAKDVVEHGSNAPLPELPDRRGPVSLLREETGPPEEPSTTASLTQQTRAGEEGTDPASRLFRPGPAERTAAGPATLPTPPAKTEGATPAPARDETRAPAEGASTQPEAEIGSPRPQSAQAQVSEPLGKEQRDVIKMMGAGKFLAPAIVEEITHVWTDLAPDTCRSTVYRSLSTLRKAGLVEKKKIDLRVSTELLQGVGKETISLTESGVAVYRDLFGSEPVDGLGTFEAKYKTVEAGIFIRLTQRVIEGWNTRPDRRWTCEVIDAVWEPDRAFEHIPGAQRRYTSPDGEHHAYPDLIVQMHPASGKPLLALVEVERGKYLESSTAAMEAKWERIVHAYPPLPIYVIGPNKATVGTKESGMFGTWLRVVRRIKARYGLPHEVNAVFYTISELERMGLYSPAQLVRQTYRNKEAKQKGDEESIVRLPRYWCEPKSKKRARGAQLEFEQTA